MKKETPQNRYDKKHYIIKAFKLDKDLVISYNEVCDKNNLQHIDAVRKAMQEVVRKYKK